MDLYNFGITEFSHIQCEVIILQSDLSPEQFGRNQLCFVYLDVKCFTRSLVRRRDSGFFTFGELCRYIRKLCHGSLLPKHNPAETNWSGLLQLQLEGVRQLSSRDFLLRLKLKSDVDSLSIRRPRGILEEKRSRQLRSGS